MLRSLIDQVVLTPADEAANGLKAEFYGDLAAILSLCEAGTLKQKHSGAEAPGSQLSVVAGTRNQREWPRIRVLA